MRKGIRITEHAKFQMNRRGITEMFVLKVVKNPEQKTKLRSKRCICQSRYFNKSEEREMLVRVVVEQTNDDLKVITAYKTSRVDKYWGRGGSIK